MELTDSEREEFTRLANATFDPGLCSEEDLPWLRAARAEYEREQAKEHLELVPTTSEHDSPPDRYSANELSAIALPEISPAMAQSQNEQGDEIASLWTAHMVAKNTARATKDELCAIRTKLAERLHEVKQMLSKPGRDGQWSGFLRNHRIPRATGDRLVACHEKLTNPDANRPNEATPVPSEKEIDTLFQSILPRLQRTLRTPASVYNFVVMLTTHYECSELMDRGILVLKPIPATTCTAPLNGGSCGEPEVGAASLARADS